MSARVGEGSSRFDVLAKYATVLKTGLPWEEEKYNLTSDLAQNLNTQKNFRNIWNPFGVSGTAHGSSET